MLATWDIAIQNKRVIDFVEIVDATMLSILTKWAASYFLRN